ncbi:uncharacterized protein LOC112342058 [Selaginella moellendorffii]|uniref:uncharacterized protein LOC112342058 n=1 Tax=Selaginella moellendorffii TaxID=88036 RepID=UPI000D1CF34B|nr:uncharacterized protein LOC112342058 [Selaginella moellendorffii]|eukprot:XP_024519011.1 uncharacterized protein LOC112342058 [Selaginella moellendorffii]
MSRSGTGAWIWIHNRSKSFYKQRQFLSSSTLLTNEEEMKRRAQTTSSKPCDAPLLSQTPSMDLKEGELRALAGGREDVFQKFFPALESRHREAYYSLVYDRM